MAPISPTRRKAANRLAAASERADLDHFYTCRACGQAVDCRNLGDVIHHEAPGHEPLPPG